MEHVLINKWILAGRDSAHFDHFCNLSDVRVPSMLALGSPPSTQLCNPLRNFSSRPTVASFAAASASLWVNALLLRIRELNHPLDATRHVELRKVELLAAKSINGVPLNVVEGETMARPGHFATGKTIKVVSILFDTFFFGKWLPNPSKWTELVDNDEAASARTSRFEIIGQAPAHWCRLWIFVWVYDPR